MIMKFYRMENEYKGWILASLGLAICAFGLSLFLIHQMNMYGYERIKKSEYHLKTGYTKSTNLENKTETKDKRLVIKLKDGKIIYLVEKEREWPEYPKIPDKIKNNQRITYLIDKNKRVLSLKVDEKEYLPIKEVKRCEDINQLIWLGLIGLTIAGGIFFIYMTFYAYQNAEENLFGQTKHRYKSIPEIIFLLSLIPTWFLLGVDRNNSTMMMIIAKAWIIWNFWILPIIIIGRFLRNPSDDYGFGMRRYEKGISTLCIAIANIYLIACSELDSGSKNFTDIGMLVAVILLIFSHFYLKNKVSKTIRCSFELVTVIYGFFFLFLLDYF